MREPIVITWARQPVPGYGAFVPSGEGAVLHPESSMTPPGIELPGENVLYVDAVMFDGRLFIVGQGHNTGACWLWNGTRWTTPCQAFGFNPCVFGSNVLYVQSAHDVLTVIDLSTCQATGSTPMAIGSQGFRSWSPRLGLVRGDLSYTHDLYRLSEYTDLTDVVGRDLIIGQGDNGLAVYAAGALRMIEQGNRRFVRAKYSPLWGVAITVVRADECQTAGLFFTVGELEAMPPIVVTKPDEPKPKPEEPMPDLMMMPEDVYRTLLACSVKFNDLHRGTDDQRREAMEKTVKTLRQRHSLRWVNKTEHSNLSAQSKDALGYVPESEGQPVHGAKQKMFMWDTINGSTRELNARGPAAEFREAYTLAPTPQDFLADTDPGTPVPTVTHRYNGGGNDTNECDLCHLSRFDPIHAVAQSKVKHAYDGGEQDNGLCDICQKPTTDALHSPAVPEEPGNEPPETEEPLDKHEFVGTFAFCGACGKAKSDPIHDMSVPLPGGSGDALLSKILASSLRIEDELKGLRVDVMKASGEMKGSLTDALPTILAALLGKR